MRAQGIDVVSLSAGEPDFDTPELIKQAALRGLQAGHTKYTPAIGTPELRQAIAEKLKRDQGLTYPEDQIIVSVGAKHSVFNALFVLLNEGDEVVIPAPYWLSYPEMVTLLGGKSRIIELSETTQFKLTPAKLKESLSPASKVLILNSPSNPTGAVYSKEEIEALAKVIKGFPKLVVISDEIYEKLIFENCKHYSIAMTGPDLQGRTIVINGLSKAYSMTGWRLGYCALPNKQIAKAIGSLQSHSTSNPTSFAQDGAVTAIREGEQDAQKMCREFESRRDLFFNMISKIPKLKPFKAQGAFYLFVNIKETGMDSLSFSEALLNEAHVAVVPGKAFGSDDHIRMSFASSVEQLQEAAGRIAAWLKK